MGGNLGKSNKVSLEGGNIFQKKTQNKKLCNSELGWGGRKGFRVINPRISQDMSSRLEGCSLSLIRFCPLGELILCKIVETSSPSFGIRQAIFNFSGQTRNGIWI